jgi:hypothetical protein
MVACLSDESMAGGPCVPACRSCGRDLVPDDAAPHRDRGRSFWRNACGCAAEREPVPDYGFTAAEVSTFEQLLTGRGCDGEVAKALAGRLLNSLAHHGTKVVLGLPEHDIVISADEAAAALGRDLRAPSDRPGGAT